MMKRLVWLISALAFVAVVLTLLFVQARQNAERMTQIKRQARADFCTRFGLKGDGQCDFFALPSFVPYSILAAKLGGILFNDARIASSSKRRCGSCHCLNQGGIDNKRHAKRLTRSVMNAVFADVYLNDGSIIGFPALVEVMLKDNKFGGLAPETGLAHLQNDKRIYTLFSHAYATGMTVSNMVDALSQYCHTLFSEQRAFDLFCSGQTNALSATAKTGFNIFKQHRCNSCHFGPSLGTLVVHNGKKVPSLRGLAHRRFYFSHGELSDLDAAVSAMPNNEMKSEDRNALLAFLQDL